MADTSPLNYLILIEAIDVLPQLYDRVLIPSAVKAEMSASVAPIEVRDWLDQVPPWVEICSPKLQLHFPVRLDRGEQEVFALAAERSIQSVLIDEQKGRTEARRRNLDVIGTLGILLAAASQHLLEPKDAYARLLAKTNFRTSPKLESAFFSQIPLS